MLFVVRPLVRRILTPEEARRCARRSARRARDLAGTGAQAAASRRARCTAAPSQTSQMIDMAQVQGQVHAQSMQKVGELAERNPHETVAIVRQWLQDAPA